MIKKFLIEKRSWICLFITLQLLSLIIAYLDSSISPQSILYIVFLSTLIFSFFLASRYHKETTFYRSLDESDLDLTPLAEARSPFEKIVEDSLKHQTIKLKKEWSENRWSLEEEKDELLAWIHEVKTPLTAMHLIIERVEDEKLKSQLTYEWFRIHLLLDQQLHQKRIPFMKNDLSIEMVNLKNVLITEIKALRSWCMHKGIGIDLQLEVAEVLSDVKWLSFIIRQLLTNAVKYSSESDIIIKSYQHGEQIKLDIIDFGRGIDAKDLPQIFDKGFTATRNHRDNASTGMGLYLAQKSAGPLLIHIEVKSKVGNGTTFTLTFPQKNEFIQITGM
jgi:two-component system, OmpR family, bacitracin resistance sensor histidine kinase BceS